MNNVVQFPGKARPANVGPAPAFVTPAARLSRARRPTIGTLLGRLMLGLLRCVAFVAVTIVFAASAMLFVLWKPLLGASILGLVFFPRSAITWCVVAAFAGAIVLPIACRKALHRLAPRAKPAELALVDDEAPAPRPPRRAQDVWARWLRRTARAQWRALSLRLIRRPGRLTLVRKQ